MKGYLALVLAFLGIAMFSGSIWMQRIWLPQVRTSQPDPAVQAVSIETEQEKDESLAGSQAEAGWPMDQVLMK